MKRQVVKRRLTCGSALKALLVLLTLMLPWHSHAQAYLPNWNQYAEKPWYEQHEDNQAFFGKVYRGIRNAPYAFKVGVDVAANDLGFVPVDTALSRAFGRGLTSKPYAVKFQSPLLQRMDEEGLGLWDVKWEIGGEALNNATLGLPSLVAMVADGDVENLTTAVLLAGASAFGARAPFFRSVSHRSFAPRVSARTVLSRISISSGISGASRWARRMVSHRERVLQGLKEISLDPLSSSLTVVGLRTHILKALERESLGRDLYRLLHVPVDRLIFVQSRTTSPGAVFRNGVRKKMALGVTTPIQVVRLRNFLDNEDYYLVTNGHHTIVADLLQQRVSALKARRPELKLGGDFEARVSDFSALSLEQQNILRESVGRFASRTIEIID